MQKSRNRVASAALLSLLLASCSGAPKQDASKQDTSQNPPATQNAAPAETTKAAPSGPIVRGKAASIHAVLTVEAVDQEKRIVTLKGPQGNTGEFEAGPEVKRLAEIKVGDKVHAVYEVAAMAELREPTAEEKSAPLVEVTADPQALPGGPPAGGMGRAVRAVTTIQAIDQPGQNFTVKDPMDGTVKIHVDDPTVFQHLKVGQTVVVTFAETFTMAVEPKAKTS